MSRDIYKIREALITVAFASDVLMPELKKKHGTYRNVAKAMGVTHVHISNIKRGFALPSIQLLNLMVQDLLEGT